MIRRTQQLEEALKKKNVFDQFEEDELQILAENRFHTAERLAAASVDALLKINLSPGSAALLVQLFSRASRPEALADGGADGGADADSYWQRVSQLPAPSSLGKIWPEYQDKHNPLFNILRPHTAQGTSPALMHEAFARFLDLVDTVPLDSATCKVTLELVKDMSASYLNTDGSTAAKLLEQHGQEMGGARWGEQERARLMRLRLLELMRATMTTYADSLEPKSVSLMEGAETDGSLCCYDTAGTPICHVLILEGKEGFGHGGGSELVMQLAAYFAKLAYSKRHMPAVKQTCFPALGLEFCGNLFRVHALYLTDKVNCQPLTPALHLSDMRLAVPGYLEQVARTLKAVMLTLDSLVELYQQFSVPAAAPGSSSGSSGEGPDAEVCQGIPYMLRGRFAKVMRLRDSAHVYACTDAAGGTRVVKVLPGRDYPWQLHAEMAAKGLAPQLLQPGLLRYAGGFSLVEMEYLDPAQGWRRLDAFRDGNPAALQLAAEAALAELQSCLEGKAAHGDLRGPNVLAKVDEGGSDEEPTTSAGNTGNSRGVKVKIIDWDWGGRVGQVCYPAFLNPEVKWPLDDPVGQAIEQWHDTEMLKRSLARCPAVQCAPSGGAGGDHAPGSKRAKVGWAGG